MLAPGDLVRITNSALRYFDGKLALVNYAVHVEEHMEGDQLLYTTHYLVTLTDASNSHIFTENELELISKAQNKKE